MRILFIIIIAALFYLSACKKDEFDYSSGVSLQFSTDSIIFDTIFSGIGSATKTFKIYNFSDKKIKISEIKLGEGTNSKYRLNIDGLASNSANNITIAANGSEKIHASTDDLTVATERAAFTLVYVDSTHGWLLTEK